VRKQLTAAAVQRLCPAKVRREIRDAGCPGLYLIIQSTGFKSWAMRFRRPGGVPAKLTLGPVDLTGREVDGEPVVGAPLTLASARRLAVGLDSQRLALLLAVLHRHGGVETAGYDVFVNAVGGVRIGEPAADLAVLLAVNSSLRNKPLPDKLMVFGEVGLAGEIRPVQRGLERIREAAKLGFRTVLMPTANRPKQGIDDVALVTVDRIDAALAHVRD